MALYKLKLTFEAIVEADSMFEALDKGHAVIMHDPSIPSVGMANLVERASQVPKLWMNRRPAGLKDGPVISERFTKAKIR